MYISEIVTTVPENVKERASLEQKVYFKSWESHLKE